MSDVIVAPQVRDLNELADSLSRWLADKLGGPVSVSNLDYPRGAGQSHETILFDAKHGGASQGYVVRIKPGSFTVFPDNLFVEQFQIMQAMHARGHVRVAKPYWLEEDSSVLGAPFFVMEKVAGRVPVSVPPYRDTGFVAEATPAQRRRMWEGGVRQLAAVQSLPLNAARFLEGAEGERDGLIQEFAKYARFVAWVQEDRPWPVLEAGLARLKSLWPDNQPEGVVWGDARLGNIMFDGNFDPVAVMDWEQPSLGGALNDLGWWLSISESMHGADGGKPHLEGMGTRAETIALWEELTGKSAADVEWFEDFARLKHSCCHVRMCALRGAPPPDATALAVRLKVN
jgi:aminoglycoside phosphotransferase (APT) family kinase protein